MCPCAQVGEQSLKYSAAESAFYINNGNKKAAMKTIESVLFPNQRGSYVLDSPTQEISPTNEGSMNLMRYNI